MTRKTMHWLKILAALAALALAVGCGGGGGSGGGTTTTTDGTTTTAEEFRLDGTWKGTWASEVVPTLKGDITIVVHQDGTAISGTITITGMPGGTYHESWAGNISNPTGPGTFTYTWDTGSGVMTMTGTYTGKKITGAYSHEIGEHGTFSVTRQ